ncbi:sodium/glutamate symporter [Parashewanella spongiae]|uniref:Sodium/glutamate symporter n=2 Tax=Parashewanella spongiae TaxID=342950 RepID=A0A3A6U8B7_9GAMM|nr:sodium/glutamate symporter [Parashewanella spongiae]RJY18168.1 sodium/glutamate symporter [Parashewanella spongiae]
MPSVFIFDSLWSFVIVIGILLLGYTLNNKILILEKFNIPPAITGGLFAAFVITLLHFNRISVSLSVPQQDMLMLMFFSSVGLNANVRKIIEGGHSILVFLALSAAFIFLQDGLGITLAKILGLEPIIGLVAGSITLTGGHGTAIAWAGVIEKNFGLNVLELSIASATFGLIVGGIIGGPLAHKRISSLKAKCFNSCASTVKMPQNSSQTTTSVEILKVLLALIFCVSSAKLIAQNVVTAEISWFRMPVFVYAIFIGIIMTNCLELLPKCKLEKFSLDFVSNLCLSLFLTMAIVNLKLWHIFDLAIPLLIILFFQTMLMVIFSYWITFNFMGRNYDAAVILGGQCGFGLGSTPTAVTIMNSIVAHHGPSNRAFLVIPIAGAFFNDLINLVIIESYLHFLK